MHFLIRTVWNIKSQHYRSIKSGGIELNKIIIQFHQLTVVSGLISSSSAGIAPKFNTRSRAVGPSPAMLPRAHTACSATCIYDEPRSCTSFGTAPCLITVFVCSDVPDAMFVSAHDASNCNDGLKQTNGFRSAIYQYSKHM